MSRPWYCRRLHGEVERHEAVDGGAVYTVRESPCDCAPPPTVAAETAPSQFLGGAPLYFTAATGSPPAVLSSSSPAAPASERGTLQMPRIPVVPPLAAGPWSPAPQQQPPPLPPLLAPTDAPSVVPPAATVIAPVSLEAPASSGGCGAADHEIYMMCGFAFCPQCGLPTTLAAGGGRVVAPTACPFPHTANIAGAEAGHRYCYLCGTALASGAAAAVPVPVPPLSPLKSAPASAPPPPAAGNPPSVVLPTGGGPTAPPPLPLPQPPASTAGEAAAAAVPAPLGIGGTAEASAAPPVIPPVPVVPAPPLPTPVDTTGAPPPAPGSGEAAPPTTTSTTTAAAAEPTATTAATAAAPAASGGAPVSLSPEEQAAFDAVLDRLVRATAANGGVVSSPCGLPYCALCRGGLHPSAAATHCEGQPLPPQHHHHSYGSCGHGSKVTVIHNYY